MLFYRIYIFKRWTLLHKLKWLIKHLKNGTTHLIHTEFSLNIQKVHSAFYDEGIELSVAIVFNFRRTFI